MLIRVIDFESTGLPPDCAIVEVGWCDVMFIDCDNITVGAPQSRFCNPGQPIPPEARAIHHISDDDIKDAVSPDVALRDLNTAQVEAWCAHNAAFEQALFTGAGKPWICSLKVAYRMYPDAPNHKNQTLRYCFGLELDHTLAMPPHRAGPDAYVTAHILADELVAEPPETLIEWTKNPTLLPGAIKFGKHRGTKWADVPPDYLDWICRQEDMDADVRFTAQHHLQQLASSAAAAAQRAQGEAGAAAAMHRACAGRG
jgi:exodeoxyribonuclease X